MTVHVLQKIIIFLVPKFRHHSIFPHLFFFSSSPRQSPRIEISGDERAYRKTRLRERSQEELRRNALFASMRRVLLSWRTRSFSPYGPLNKKGVLVLRTTLLFPRRKCRPRYPGFLAGPPNHAQMSRTLPTFLYPSSDIRGSGSFSR